MKWKFFIVIALVCASLPFSVHAQDVASRRAELQRQLNDLETQITETQGTLDTLHGERSSLERDVQILDGQIKKAKLQVKATEIAIEQLSTSITTHANTIASLTSKLERERASLGQIVRSTAVIDDSSIVEVALSSKDVSSFFSDLDSFTSIKQSLGNSLAQVTDTRSQTEEEKVALETRRSSQLELRRLQVLEQKSIEQQEKQKQQILAQTKGQEAAYKKLVQSQQQSAAQIRNALFSLQGSGAIPFEQALQFANTASKATGVRPAVILGILKQETNVGQNIGKGTWKVDMHPTRDQPIFVYITQILGLDPDKMPVSKKPPYGWGGAMGPGQFIPSTWVCYGGLINSNTGDCSNARGLAWTAFWAGPWEYDASKDRIRKLTGGSSASSPWNNRDAFMAVGMLMADNGASAGTRTAERKAALRYFAGWTNASNPAYAFYGDGVMGFADDFQKQIDYLNGS